MKFTFFKSSIEEGKFSSIYLFEGEDGFFREKSLKILQDKFISEPSLNFAVFDGENFDESEFLSSLTSYPFMSEFRLTAIKEFYPKPALVGKIEKALENNSTSILAVLNSKNNDALKKISGVEIVDCGKGDINTLSKWIKSYCAQSKIEIDMQTASQLVEYCLRDMKRIELETEKLIAYSSKKGKIDLADVDELVNQESDYKIYNLTDCIAKKQFEKAMKIVNDMLSKGETYQMILVAVYNYLRKLLHIRISSIGDQETQKLLGMQEYAYKKSKEQAFKFNPKSLKKAIDRLSNIDYEIKSGMLDAENGVLNTIFSIMLEK